MGRSIRILYVDDNINFLDITADSLKKESERFQITTVQRPGVALERLAEEPFDCVVSDYDMDEMDGIEFLHEVREVYDDLPFILFTGKGSEEIASEAISAGVTDYLQKKGTLEQYTLLGNRIENAVEARMATRDSKRRMQEYETLIESAPVPMAVVDEDGTLLYVNESGQEILGVEAATEGDRTSILEFVHPDDRDACRDGIGDAAREREPTESREYRLVSTSNEEKIVKGSVVPVTFAGRTAAQLVFADITAQQRREEELRELNQFREAVIENASVWLTVLDDGGEVLVWNRAATEISGYEADEMIGTDDWMERLYPDEEYREEVIEQIAEILRSGGDVEGYETTITTADGEKRRIYWDAHSLTGTADEYDGVVSVGWDITEQHERTEQLKTLHEGTRDLMEATDSESVAELVAGVAKDILGYEYTAVRFVDEGEQVLEPVAVTEEVSEALGDRPNYPLDGESPHAEVYNQDERLLFDDVREVNDDYDREPVRSAMYLPLGDYGMVTICDPAVGAFDQSDIEFASILLANAEAALDRLERQQEMAEIREQLRSFLRGTTDIITLVDTDGKIQYQSPAIEDVLGYTQDELLGERVFDLIHPDDREEAVERFASTVERTDPSVESFEFRIKHADGSWVWLEAQTRIEEQQNLDGYVVTSREISDRKENEQQIKRERERFSALFENFPEPTIAYQYEDGIPIVRSVNAAFEKTFGYDDEAAVGEPIDDLIVPEEKKEEAKQIDQHVQDGKLIDQRVSRMTADGLRTFNFRNIPYRDGEHVDGFAVYNDIHRRVERERELERQNERLDEFASIIAHDLRNPLNVAQTRTELVERECDSEHLEDIRQAHDRMEALLEETLILARQGEMVSDLEPVRIADVVRECHEMIGTDGSTAVIEDDVQIHCDRDRIRQLFDNLISNAIDHGGNDVEIRVGMLEDDGIYIEDDGPGITTSESEKIFKPGYTDSDDGTGLGLAIVSRIVEAHDWHITVTESGDGRVSDERSESGIRETQSSPGARFEITGVDFEAVW